MLVTLVMDVVTRGCSSNKDCANNQYCGSDFECHDFPEKIIVKQNEYVPAAIIIAAGMIAMAVVIKWRKE
ncbi:hypothetical protein HYX11_02685 [Candidatus Woesearchaeota archaeon]|nr:hypothetical protein [Candidatus Woesearchaeota archaeon]